VLYAIRSPIMGGRSRWKILQDPEISRVIPEVFGRAPEVAGAALFHPLRRLQPAAPVAVVHNFCKLSLIILAIS
jgi:hypothetical protein